MPDFDAMAGAVAARYAAAAITASGGPPAGYTNVRKATADPPQQISAVPIVIVFPDHGQATRIGGGTRELDNSFIVRFYFGLSRNLERELVALRKWLTILLDQHKTAMQLGGTVTAVRTLSWRIGLLPYGTKSYAGIELGVQVVTTEAWSPTS